jgi:hypothetical protein
MASSLMLTVKGVIACFDIPHSYDFRCGAPPTRSTPATCDPPGHPNSAAPAEPGNSNSASGSPPDTRTEWRWRQLLAAEVPSTTADLFLPELTERLSNLTRAGFDATLLVRSAAATGPLPDDHPAAALWWRILDQLPPQTPNPDSATSGAVPAARQTTTTSLEQRRSRPRMAPPPALGPSR